MAPTTTMALAAILLLSTTTHAGPTDAQKCESSKLKEAGKYASCRLKAESKAVKKGEAADYMKCEDKFSDKWGKIEGKAGIGVCPSEGDESSMDSRITTEAAEIATLLAGGSVGDCGNGSIETGEDCDLGDLNGETCSDQGLFGEGLACGAGCVYDTSGCSATRYEDTGLGTVIDHQTGLEWQKTDDAGGLTDKDNAYTWTDTAGGSAPNGTAFTDFLGGLNGGISGSSSGPTTGCYAGHCDWRLPLVEELGTIFDCGLADPKIDQAVFGDVNAGTYYWSSSTATGPQFPKEAWLSSLSGCALLPTLKDFGGAQARAVRGGS